MSLEKYSIGKVIGKGSYGEVFLVKHKKDRKQYVLKKVDLQKASVKERKSAELEAKLLSQLRHPNIVSYRESFQDEKGYLYIVMNFCEGGDLYSKLKAQKGSLLVENQVVEWFVQIAMALQYMHEKHILHRDLKTQNIFLTKSKIIKVGDLGIAKVLESSSDMATTLIGTPYYMSPELFSNKPYNHKSDVWALGCCLFEMCTLRHAFNAKDMSSLVYKILKGKIPPLPKQYSGDLCSIIRTMLDQDPDQRPSASRLLRHSYIKKQIALFLEGTKNRQKQKKSTGVKNQQLPINGPTKSSSGSKVDSGYSGSNLESSIATVSGVDCVIGDSQPPRKPSQSPTHSKGRKASTESSSVESSSSSTGSSDKGQTEISIISGDKGKELEKDRRVGNEKGQAHKVVQKEREKELIRKQMAERRKSAAEKATRNQEKQRFSEERRPRCAQGEKESKEQRQPVEERPVPRVRSAGSSRSSGDEAKVAKGLRPLPRPPAVTPRIQDAPMSRSPRARRRYKVSGSAGPRSQSDEEGVADEGDEKSIASVDSDRSSKSVSESTPQSCSMSARERRRLKQNAAAAMPSPAVSYDTPPLPSPREMIAARVRMSQESQGEATPKQAGVIPDPRRNIQSSSQDCVDGPPMERQPRLGSVDSDSESNSTGSDLEEINLDEPSAQVRKHRHKSEVSSLISALDTTLKLGDKSADRESPEMDTCQPDEQEELLVPSGASPTTSGRLRDRIERLRSDCVRGIGQEQLNRAYRIIEALDEDNVEEALVDLMGREHFEKYGGAIWQLKFCESFRIN